jgi:RecB family endonuclease NucS
MSNAVYSFLSSLEIRNIKRRYCVIQKDKNNEEFTIVSKRYKSKHNASAALGRMLDQYNKNGGRND